ncbi:MAG: hypothetical protein K8T10_03530 [Candidatus Eremiobacteraeota bacterium]|nr:hypothetical protein [Candidatus Eremiobacteraeota bacterium]
MIKNHIVFIALFCLLHLVVSGCGGDGLSRTEPQEGDSFTVYQTVDDVDVANTTFTVRSIQTALDTEPVLMLLESTQDVQEMEDFLAEVNISTAQLRQYSDSFGLGDEDFKDLAVDYGTADFSDLIILLTSVENDDSFANILGFLIAMDINIREFDTIMTQAYGENYLEQMQANGNDLKTFYEAYLGSEAETLQAFVASYPLDSRVERNVSPYIMFTPLTNIYNIIIASKPEAMSSAYRFRQPLISKKETNDAYYTTGTPSRKRVGYRIRAGLDMKIEGVAHYKCEYNGHNPGVGKSSYCRNVFFYCAQLTTYGYGVIRFHIPKCEVIPCKDLSIANPNSPPFIPKQTVRIIPHMKTTSLGFIPLKHWTNTFIFEVSGDRGMQYR